MSATERLRVSVPSFSRLGDGGILLQAQVEGLGARRTIHFRITGAAGEIKREDVSSNCFAVGLLLPAMERGLDLHLDGDASSVLIHSLNHNVVPLLLGTIPGLNQVRVSAAGRRAKEGRKGRGAAAGLSAGIDSFVTVMDYLLADDVPDEKRIETFLFHDVGSHGNPEDPEMAAVRFTNRLAGARQLAERLGKPLLVIESNIGDLYRASFVMSHTVRNAAAALSVEWAFETYLYSSSFAVSQCRGGVATDMAFSEPILLPLLNTESAAFCSVGGEHTRLEKTLRVLNSPLAEEFIDVCAGPSDGSRNCGCCWKCGWFLTMAQAEGKLEKFRSRFDVAAWERRKLRLWRQVIEHGLRADGQPNHKDAFAYMRRKGLKIPRRLYLLAAASVVWSRARAAVRRMASRTRRAPARLRRARLARDH